MGVLIFVYFVLCDRVVMLVWVILIRFSGCINLVKVLIFFGVLVSLKIKFFSVVFIMFVWKIFVR